MIAPENFFWIVTILAIIYSLLVRLIQMKLVDQGKIKSLQKRMNELNKEYLSALRSSNRKRMDSIQEEQNKLMPEFNKMMVGQLKLMAVIVMVFLAFMIPLNSLDPCTKDDMAFELAPSGGQFCGSFPVSCSSPGPWLVEVTAFSGGHEMGTNSTYVFCGSEEAVTLPSLVMKGTLFPITTDKKVYSQNDTARVCIPAQGIDRAVGKTDSGTWFMVALPFTIPVLEANAINGANIWFILVSIFFGLVFSFVHGKIRKGEKK